MLETVLWEHWPSTWPTIPSYPWRKWSGSLTASHQWASRHRGHNLHILTGRTCLRTFSNWLSSSLYWFYLMPDSIILLRFSSADWKGQQSLFASHFRNPVCFCCTAVDGVWVVGLKHSTAALSGPTQPCALLNYMKFTANTCRVLGSWQYLHLILSEVLMWNGSTWSRALALGLELQCSNSRASVWLTTKPRTWSLGVPVPTCLRSGTALCAPPHSARSLQLQTGHHCYWGRLWKMSLATLLWTHAS